MLILRKDVGRKVILRNGTKTTLIDYGEHFNNVFTTREGRTYTPEGYEYKDRRQTMYDIVRFDGGPIVDDFDVNTPMNAALDPVEAATAWISQEPRLSWPEFPRSVGVASFHAGYEQAVKDLGV